MSIVNEENTTKKYSKKAKAAAKPGLSPEAEKILTEKRKKAPEAEEAEVEVKEAEAQPEEKSEEPKAAPDSGHKVVEDPAPQPVEQTPETPAAPAPEAQSEAGKHNPAPHIQSASVKSTRSCHLAAEQRVTKWGFTEAEAEVFYEKFKQQGKLLNDLINSQGQKVRIYRPYYSCFGDGTYDVRYEKVPIEALANEKIFEVVFIGHEDKNGVYDDSMDPLAQRAEYIIRREARNIAQQNVVCPWK